jgi:hypothetical protein
LQRGTFGTSPDEAPTIALVRLFQGSQSLAVSDKAIEFGQEEGRLLALSVKPVQCLRCRP